MSAVQQAMNGYYHPLHAYPANLPSSGEQNNGGPVMVEILVDGIWTDITAYVMTRGDTPVSITYGQSDETSSVSPASCTFQINNRDGRFSPRNTASPLYGKIGRNTQLRVSVPLGFGKSYRFWGETPAWPQDWDTTGTDFWVAMEAYGPLRRFNQSVTVSGSAMYQALAAGSPGADLSGTVIGYSPNPPVAYWALEDPSGSTSMASAAPGGGTPMLITGTPTLSSSTVFPGSSPLPVMASGSFSGTVPVHTDTEQDQVRVLISVPAGGIATLSRLIRIQSTGACALTEVYYGGGQFNIIWYDNTGAVLNTTGPVAVSIDGKLVRLCVDWNAAVCTVTVVDILASTATVIGPNTSGSIRTVSGVAVAPDKNLTSVVFGHLSVQNKTSSASDLGGTTIGAVSGFLDEPADTRAHRLLLQNGFAYSSVGQPAVGTLLGVQLPDTPPNLLKQCTDADTGFLFEDKTQLAVGMWSRAFFYSQPYFLTLDYAAYQLTAVPMPTDDDRYTKNDVTVSRINGASSRSVQSVGPLNTSPPPTGVGSYQDAPSLNLPTDQATADQAGWRVYVGTVDLPRFSAVSVNLAHPSFYAGGTNATRTQVLTMIPGLRMGIKNLPAQCGYAPLDTAGMYVIGSTETIDQFQHVINFVTTPDLAYQQVSSTGDGYTRSDTDGSTLTNGIGPSDTSFLVTKTNPAVLWTTAAGDLPFDILMGGERMTVGAVSGSSSPQTFSSVTRSVNGVVRSHNGGAALSLYSPTYLQLY